MTTIDTADEFADRSRLFLTTINRGEDDELAILAHLAGLYAAAFGLSVVEPGDDEPAESTTIRPRLRAGLGIYSTTVDALDPASDLACGDLNDDLRDIARDLADGLALFDRGATSSAIWHWRFTFESHWGRHAVEAIRVLHHVAATRSFST